MAENESEDKPVEAVPSEPGQVIKPQGTQSADENLPAPNLDDSTTDQAVKEIAVSEGDQVLADEDAAVRPPQPPANDWKARLKRVLKNKWTWIGLLAVIVILLGVPQTRYKILGLFVKKSVVVTLIDSKTDRPVSAAEVQVAGVTGKTDGAGKLRFKAGVGPHTVTVQKHYYRSTKVEYFVGLKSPKPLNVRLNATGRLVPVTILNKLTGQPVKNVEINVLNTSAKTDSKGQTIIALPARDDKEIGNMQLDGYNTASITIQITDQQVAVNTFNIVPAGHIYFLSNLSGNIDVVRADLDGSRRKIVFAGTGREDPRSTSLLASRDWRYVVLKANREGSQASLFVIDGSNDKVTQFDSSIGDFNLVGWYGHSFMYDLARNSLSNWQSGKQLLKSYDAEHAQLNQLDQTQAEGTPDSYAYQTFYNFYIVNGAVVYNTQWYTYNASGAAYNTASKNDSIRSIQPNGQSKRDLQTWPANTNGSVQAVSYEPGAVYYAVYSNNTAKTTYYVYEDQAVKVANIDNGDFNKPYPTFLISPSGSRTLWTELRDGKNTLFTGDSNAQNKQQLDTNGEYAPYGWFSDSYLLVSKGNSELYIMPAKDQKIKKSPLKITNYYKPPQTYPGYGYGYGGI